MLTAELEPEAKNGSIRDMAKVTTVSKSDS